MEDPVYIAVGSTLILAAIPAIAHASKQYKHNKNSYNVILSLTDALVTLITGLMLLIAGTGSSIIVNVNECNSQTMIADSAIVLVPSINTFTSIAVRAGFCLHKCCSANNCHRKRKIIATGITWSIPAFAVLTLLPVKTNQYQVLKNNSNTDTDVQSMCELDGATFLPKPKEYLMPCTISPSELTISNSPMKRRTDDVRYIADQTVRRIYEIVNLTLHEKLDFSKIEKREVNYEDEDYAYDTAEGETGPERVEVVPDETSPEEFKTESDDSDFLETTMMTTSSLNQTSNETLFQPTDSEQYITTENIASTNEITTTERYNQSSLTALQVNNATTDFCVAYCYMEVGSLRGHVFFLLIAVYILPVVIAGVLYALSSHHSSNVSDLLQYECHQINRMRSLTLRAGIICISLWLPALVDTVLRSVLCISEVPSDISRMFVIVGLLQSIVQSAFGAKFAALGNKEITPLKNLAPDKMTIVTSSGKWIDSEQPGTSSNKNDILQESVRSKPMSFNLCKIFSINKNPNKQNVMTQVCNRISKKFTFNNKETTAEVERECTSNIDESRS